MHVGARPPSWWDERERLQAALVPGDREERERVVSEGLDWASVGLRPRWIGDDTSTAIAAIEASNFADKGADEWRRFQTGAHARGERALYISTIGPTPDDVPFRSVFGRTEHVEMPYLGPHSRSICGDPIRLARPPRLADDLTSTDRDLALRILNEHSEDVEWVAFRPRRPQEGGFIGTWTPLLITPDAKVVAGVWRDAGACPEGQINHYMLPALPSYLPILQWLTERAVPDLVPTAAARLRKYVDAKPCLQTELERELTSRIAIIMEQYGKEKLDLEQQLDAARRAARLVRDPLLFGMGEALEDAVARVLIDADVRVVRLDEKFGTVSADLLAERGGRRILVEVKSASGNASERLVDAPLKHLRTWPQVKPDVPVDGAALIVNHQHKRPPAERSSAVYEREAFVDSLEVPVVATLQLFDAWRRADWPEVRALIGFPSELPTTSTIAPEFAEPGTASRRPWWRFGKTTE
ncbi:hypothetical protein GCM10007368_30450 [Isoptericola cucumis]|uniref:DUF3883 domain-containing protein n=1 Tax=Isoptericola cucumis TaxID=1776856 RepID=A0ABQ2BC13_9MICO|nr:hypothetical protein GCM10007368_30450 [Isoptericola cucumis]